MTTGYSIIQIFLNKLTGYKSIFLDSSSLLGFVIFKNLAVSILLYFSNISGTKDSTCFGRFKKNVGDICVPMADSHWGLTEKNKIL